MVAPRCSLHEYPTSYREVRQDSSSFDAEYTGTRLPALSPFEPSQFPVLATMSSTARRNLFPTEFTPLIFAFRHRAFNHVLGKVFLTIHVHDFFTPTFEKKR